jgi:hypothetical protein
VRWLPLLAVFAGVWTPVTCLGQVHPMPSPDFRQAILTGQFVRDHAVSDSGTLCVLMDWSLGGGSVTLAAFKDGTTSLYYSNGGGMIGLGAHATVRSAAMIFREAAIPVDNSFAPIASFSLPPTGTVRFYLVSSTGTRATAAYSESELQNPAHPLYHLALAAQAVIAAAQALPGTAAR